MQGSSSVNSSFQYGINSHLFNSEEYLTKIQKESSLSQLSDIQQITSKQLRELDIKMQNLVYDNYNKFISATNAVKNMKIDLEEMEPMIHDMASSVEFITDFTSEIQKSLNSGRKQLISCYSYQTSLKRLQILISLPEKLTKFAKTRNFDSAVEFFVKTRKFYSKFSTNQNLAAAAEETRAIMAGITKSLTEVLRTGESASSREELSMTVGLLLKLGHDEAELAKEYLAGGENTMSSNLDQLEDISKFIHYFDNFMNSGCLTFIHSLSTVSDTFAHIFNAHLKTDKFAFLQKFIIDFNIRMTERLFRIINTSFTSGVEDMVGIRLLLPILRRLNSLNYIMPRYFKLDIESLFLSVLRNRIALHFENLNDRVKNLYNRVVKEMSSDKSIFNAVETLHAELVEGMDNSLISLNGFFDSDDVSLSSAHAQTEIMDGFIYGFIKNISKHKFYKIDVDTTDGSIFLFQAKLCVVLADKTVPEIVSSARRILSLPVPSNYSVFIYDLKTESTFILGDYAKYHGRRFSQNLLNSVNNEGANNGRVSDAMLSIVDCYRGVAELLKTLYPYSERSNLTCSESSIPSSVRQLNLKDIKWRSNGFLTSNDSTSLLRKNIQKLFAERIEIFLPLVSSQTCILDGITKIFFKNFVEYIRLCTLTETTVRQIQLDFHYFSEMSFASSTELFMLFDEIMSSALTRCAGNCELMDLQVIDEIVAASK